MSLPYDPKSLPQLPWTNPGHRPYTGPFEAALRHYAGEIPRLPLNELVRQIERPAENGRYVVIDRTGIRSPDRRYTYGDLRMMHFAEGQVLRAVLDTTMWPADMSTGALVFHADQYCICIPTVCRNVSIVTQLTPRVAAPYTPTRIGRVPEPSSIALLAIAAGAAWITRRKTPKPRS